MIKILLLILSFTIALLLYLYLSLRQNLKQIHTDILEKKQTESILLLQNKKKDKLVQNLTKEINDLFNDIQQVKVRSEKEKQTLDLALHNITHDIRTPLTVAHGFAQELLRKEKNESLEKIQRNLQIISERLEILLEFQRLLEKRISPDIKKVNLTSILKDELIQNYESLKAFEVRHDLAEDFFISSDPEFTKRILQNIFGNVAKHGKKTLQIQVENRGEFILLKVTNQVQKAIENLNQLATRFYSENMSETEKSSGLGIYIIKELIELLEGHLKMSYENEHFSIEIYWRKS